MNVVALVPARGGSKGFPRKNLALLEGRSLVEIAVAAALEANTITRVAVSTDDAEIAAVARAAGATVVVRPSELGGDDVGALAVLQHGLDVLEGDGAIDAIAYLQPTSPLRTAAHVDGAVAMLTSQVDAVVTVVEVPHRYTPDSLLDIDADGFVIPASHELPLRRQDKAHLVARNGPAVLAIRASAIRAGELYPRQTVAMRMSILDSVDVDSPQDLLLARAILLMRRQS